MEMEAFMGWSEAKLHPLFGAELTNDRHIVDVADSDCKALVTAVETHGVVLVRGNLLSDAELLAFGKRLGKIYNAEGTAYYDPSGGVLRISNVDTDGNVLPADDDRVRISAANRLWHTDSTFVRPRVSISLLNALVVTPAGGETQYCDTRLAYDALTDEQKERFSGLKAFHTILHSRSLVGYDSWTPEQRKTFVGLERPLVHLHEPSGKMALYLASHIMTVGDLDKEESQALVNDLTAQATKPELVYTHAWQPGDLILWDNRCTLHRVLPYAYDLPRDYRSIRLVDVEDR
jgi:alpha-ketoglutarate-dependent 2,4-dichlorophenoxyacetate dioxygenase